MVLVLEYSYHGTHVPFGTMHGGSNFFTAMLWLLQFGDTNCTMVPMVPLVQDDHPWNPQTRTTTETVLREAMQALVRVQAHMLARIVVERCRHRCRVGTSTVDLLC
jgi:hypothetical protein